MRIWCPLVAVLFLSACQSGSSSSIPVISHPALPAYDPPKIDLPPVNLVAGCSAFSGAWNAITGNTAPFYEGVEISYNDFNNALTIEYNTASREDSRRFAEAYLVDGQLHTDFGRNAGTSYRVSCGDGEISITRQSPTGEPHTTFTVKGDRLVMKSVAGDKTVWENFERAKP